MTSTGFQSRVIFASLAMSLSLLAIPAQAAPQSETVEQASRVLQLNRDAMEMFGELEFELAESTLNQAVALVDGSAGLVRHTVAVKTFINFGIVYAVGLKDRDKAALQFGRALAINPSAQLPAEQSSPEAVEAFSIAKLPPDKRPVATPPVLESVAPVASTGGVRAKGMLPLRCPASGEVFAGDDVTLKCITQAGFEATSVVLYYKAIGVEEFESVPMQASRSRSNRITWMGQIPGSAVQGTFLPFYFEAHSEQGETIATAGRFDSPSLISIKGAFLDDGPSAAQTISNKESDEDPLVRKGLGQKRPEAAARDGRFFMGLGLGSGFGYAAGPGVETYREYVRNYTPGIAGYGLGHGLPELGLYVSPTVALTLQGRIQYIPRPDNATAGGATLVLARALFFTDSGPNRFYGSVSLGGGEGFRMVVDARTVSGKTVQDTVRGGPIVAGGGVGGSFDLFTTDGNAICSWIIEANLLAGLPDFSLGLDFNTGIHYAF
ncbi:MAG: hypothetical protein SGI86_12690 [Deltaproteobacteria bacterium]|nr:hypothetical protein [Deltaproteobacteria bacterium]